MQADHPWLQNAVIRPGTSIRGGFDIGFDRQVPQSTREELRRFVRWMEKQFSFPVTLWVDFEYRHYLKLATGRRWKR